MSETPLIVITGPTASGKTALAIKLARLMSGEIVCADSRTVYRGMDIGTAKPTALEQAEAPHWGLDLANPNERFTLYDFQQYAEHKIDAIRRRGHVPLLVGGSGLYISAIIYHYNLTSKKCTQIDNNTAVIGVKLARDELNKRSVQRAEAMLDAGLVREAIELTSEYGDVPPLRRNAYGVVWAALLEAGGDVTKLDRAKLVGALARADRQLVKKQLTWWRSPRRQADVWWRTSEELEAFLADHAGQPSDEIAACLLAEYKNFRFSRASLDNGGAPR